MIRTGEEYRESIRDGREVYSDGEKVADVPSHPMFKPIVDIRARIYDMAHEEATKDLMTYEDDGGEPHAIGLSCLCHKRIGTRSEPQRMPCSMTLAGS